MTLLPTVGECPSFWGCRQLTRWLCQWREGEMEKSPSEYHYSHRSYEIANNIFIGMVGAPYKAEESMSRSPTNMAQNPATLDEKVKLKSKFIIPAFGTLIVHGRTECMIMMDRKLWVLTQAPYPEDRANLPNSLYVMGTCTELKPGSHNVSVVIQNGTAKDIHMPSEWQITCMMTKEIVPDAEGSPELMKKLEEEDPQPHCQMTTEEWQTLLMETLEKKGGLEGLRNWPPELAWKAQRLLLEFHLVFSLEPNEMGCTNTTEHVTEVMSSEPFKEHFRRIVPSMVEEVQQHIQEMLDGGTICPSQSPWCNVVILVRVLHWLLMAEWMNKEGCLPPSQDAGADGVNGRWSRVSNWSLDFGKSRWWRNLFSTWP